MSAQIGISDDIYSLNLTKSSDTIINSIFANAFKINLKFDKSKIDFKYFNIFPGKQYKFLAGLIDYEKPTFIIDIEQALGCHQE